MKTPSFKKLIAAMAVIAACLMPMNVQAQAGALFVNGDMTQLKTVADIQSAAGNAAGNEITVTGKLTGITETLVLTVPAEKTVKWRAEYEGSVSGDFEKLIDFTGDGTLSIETGGVINNTGSNGSVIQVSNNGTVVVDGGTVTGDGNGINFNGSNSKAVLEVKSGKVQSRSRNAINANAVGDNSTVLIKGGEVSTAASSYSAISLSSSAALSISGGEVKNTADPSLAVSTNMVNMVYVSGGTDCGWKYSSINRLYRPLYRQQCGKVQWFL
ncbi:MAG: hypothetical protein LBI42_03940 [Chitinispirillales bacterium]|jgi:hypothetical protein|nr:hypothetical protein [Chitinispirillales bacterium]